MNGKLSIILVLLAFASLPPAAGRSLEHVCVFLHPPGVSTSAFECFMGEPCIQRSPDGIYVYTFSGCLPPKEDMPAWVCVAGVVALGPSPVAAPSIPTKEIACVCINTHEMPEPWVCVRVGTPLLA